MEEKMANKKENKEEIKEEPKKKKKWGILPGDPAIILGE